MSTETVDQLRVVSARRGVVGRFVDIWRYRQLLILMVRTELKVKYKNSALGFFWSMLNPALYLVVFYVVFQLILKNGVPSFAIFLLSGLLVWNLWSASVGGGTSAIVANSAIVQKVLFPREILPLSTVGAGLLHFFLQALVLVIALAGFRYGVGWEYLPLIPLALVVTLILAAALAIGLSAINVYLRDMAHFIELALLAWFWMTPIVYPYPLVADRGGLLAQVYSLNPVTSVVLAFQRAVYNQATPESTTGAKGTVINILPDAGIGWYTWHLLLVGLVGIVLLVAAVAFFGRVEGNFSEEL